MKPPAQHPRRFAPARGRAFRRVALLVCLLGAANGCALSQPKKAIAYEPPDERFVLFASGSADVAGPDSHFSLGYVVAMLEAHPEYNVLIVGHADQSGPSAKNRELCFKRARALRKVLVSRGVAEGRVSVAAPQSGDGATSAALSRRADVYLFDPSQEEITKRLGYDAEVRKD